MRLGLLIIIAVLLIPTCYSIAQSNNSETLTITTYYPSPYGVYRNLEAKKALSVGNFTGAPSGLTSVQDLQDGQLYVGYSEIFKGLSSDPPGKTGQVIYNSNDKMLKFYNGTSWINATCSFPLCGSSNGQSLSAAPAASTLCAVGIASAVTTLPNSWTWSCTSTDGKNVASCMAIRNIVGACGPAIGNYPYTATGFSGALCTSGTVSPASTSFPGAGGSVNWSCLGSSGTGPSCSASVASAPLPPCYHTSCPAGTMASAPYPITSSSGRVQCMFCTSCPANWCNTGSCGFLYYPCSSLTGCWCY